MPAGFTVSTLKFKRKFFYRFLFFFLSLSFFPLFLYCFLLSISKIETKKNPPTNTLDKIRYNMTDFGTLKQFKERQRWKIYVTLLRALLNFFLYRPQRVYKGFSSLFPAMELWKEEKWISYMIVWISILGKCLGDINKLKFKYVLEYSSHENVGEICRCR